jgi:anti-anti-sigma regulatory factor
VANLSHFEAIPSVLLGRVLRLHRVLDKAGGRLKLCSLSPKVRIALEATNLEGVFDICDNEASALASF